mmetsp:Transcript_23304/g.68851  ORF Transcript_23304/g.68851 Transcript_23304/m.68851 type:complete len:106 (-) Transcript_23304:577-894(-)
MSPRARAARDAFEYGVMCMLGSVLVSGIGVYIYAQSTPDAYGNKRRMKLDLDERTNPSIAFRGMWDELVGKERWTGSPRLPPPSTGSSSSSSAPSSGGGEGRQVK